MEALLLKSLSKLRKATTRSHRELRDVIDAAQANATSEPREIPFEPFLLACFTRSGKLVAVSLDCMEKFLAFGYFPANSGIPDSIRRRMVHNAASSSSRRAVNGAPTPSTSQSTPREATFGHEDEGHDDMERLMDCLVAVACELNDHPDENVQIQVLRVLLTAVTTSQVHEHALLKAVRACYHVQLMSKSATTRTVAKATLQQIICSVFQRMETFDRRYEDEIPALDASDGETGSEIYSSTLSTLYPSVAMLFQLDPRSKTSKTTYSRSEMDPQAPISSTFPSVLHKDAFLLFRSLCRISMRAVADDTTSSPSSSPSNAPPPASMDDPFAFQSKLLSLELVKTILDQAGPSFRRGERFVHAIRQYLCQSLLQNCTSHATAIVSLSLQVFLVLVRHFKRHLKTELEIFMTTIFFRLLTSENASFDHKVLVLEALQAICDDPMTLSEIFLNYDCEWNTNDLFQQIVHVLAKVAKGGHVLDVPATLSTSSRLKIQHQDAALALKGLECLTSTAASLKKAANFMETTSSELEDEEMDEISDENDATMAVEAFASKQKQQNELTTGILKFNVKPSAGIAYLKATGHLEDGSARHVAAFLHEYKDKLDKTMVGEYLGNGVTYQGGFCLDVLHEYVAALDFEGMEIDQAIRHFLAGFRLPGESQKIDRMMEQFAARYCHCCPASVCADADTAFILSFSIIMLQTDLHNPSIPEEKKMDKAGFLRNNRGIHGGHDLPEAFMSAIYDRIKATPISLKEDEEWKTKKQSSVPPSSSSLLLGFGVSEATSDRIRRDKFMKERVSMVQHSTQLIKRRVAPRRGRFAPSKTSKNSSFLLTSVSSFRHVSSLSTQHVRPMFATLWAPLLAACSLTFERGNSVEAIQLCLDSFRHAVHLAARLHMRAERDAFVVVLAKFTALQTANSRVLQAKNVEAIKTLIGISVKEGNYLDDAWHDVLQTLSQLAYLQVIATERGGNGGLEGTGPYILSSKVHYQQQDKPSPTLLTPTMMHPKRSLTTVLSPSATTMLKSPVEMDEMHVEEENAARVVHEIDQLASDRVFSSSVSLTDDALQAFVVQLTVVSLAECSGIGLGGVAGARPRVFSLQKLVEVADMNMHTRSRHVWATTWRTLSRHFTTIGCHEDLNVSMYAIDSLRQLSMKFLEKGESEAMDEKKSHQSFQRLFLAPFEVIMANATSCETRELVLRCIENLVLARVQTIRSGWQTIWNVLRIAAETLGPGHEERVVVVAFDIARKVLESHFDALKDVFVDIIECLLAFGVCGVEEVERGGRECLRLTQLGVESIRLMRNVCIEHLATEKKYVFQGEEEEEARNKPLIGFKKLEDDGKSGPFKVLSPRRYQKQLSMRMEGLKRDEDDDGKEGLEEVIVFDDSAGHTRLWWPLLTALSTLAVDQRLDVRVAALEALFDALVTHGRKFSSGLWKLVFQGVLIPLLTDLRQLERGLDKNQPNVPKLTEVPPNVPKLTETPPSVPELTEIPPNVPKQTSRMPAYTVGKTTSTWCLECVLECFGQFYDRVGFLPDVLFLLGNCMDAGEVEEQLAAAAARALEEMLVTHGHKFSEGVWGLIADELRNVMKRAEPTWIFFALPGPLDDEIEGPVAPLVSPRLPSLLSLYPQVVALLGFRFATRFPPKRIGVDEMDAQGVPSRTHLAVLLALQRVVGTVLASRQSRALALSDGHTHSLLACLRESFGFARRVNDAMPLRRYLHHIGWRYGLSGPSSGEVSSLLPHEVVGKQQYLHVLCTVLRQEQSTVAADEARKDMARLVDATLTEYLAWNRTVGDESTGPDDAHQRVASFTSLIVGILTDIATFETIELQRHLTWLYPLLTNLVMVPNTEVRVALANVFKKAIGQMVLLEKGQE